MSWLSHIRSSSVLPVARFTILLIPSALLSQELPDSLAGSPSLVNELTLPLSRALTDSVVRLPHQFIVAQSETLILGPSRQLVDGVEYTIDYRLGTVRLDSTFVAESLLDTTGRGNDIRVRYRYLPFRFQDTYFRRQLTVLEDSAGRDTLMVAKPAASFGLADIFGPDLQKSGSIVRGFTVGSNRDLSLNSGLRMQLAGKIASDIEVTAALTDESTPIQPEGTTQTLQEFDKVFVEIRSTDVAATLGDFNIEFTGTEFARLSRKLQGAKGTADYRLGFSSGTATISGAAARGKFNTNQFQGIEAVQGPYRLTGRNNERSIIVIAGTERVYANGEQQTRGETNDYTIDYATSEVTFTPHRLITAASRIVIDFEYTDRQYSRTLLATQTSSNFFDNSAKLTFTYFREADDPDAPIDFSLDDSARTVLALAGDDRNKAVLDGVTQVSANGLYKRIDTTYVDTTMGGVDTVNVTFYRFAPGDSAAVYTITFTDVGLGNGEYIRKRAGEFEWKGPRQGSYLPLRFLPFAQNQQLMDISIETTLWKDLKISGEFGRSIFDANRFSSLEDDDNGGHALNFAAILAPSAVKIGGTDIGAFELQFKERYVDRLFVPIDRTNDIEFNRKWGIDNPTQSDEEIQEASLKYIPAKGIAVGGGYGKITRTSQLHSTRIASNLRILAEGLPATNYDMENVRSTEFAVDNTSSWFRQKGGIEYTLGKLTPGMRIENENREIWSISSGVLKPGSFKFDVFAPGIKIHPVEPVSLSSEFEWRWDYVFNAGSVAKESRSETQAYSAKLSEWNNLSSTVDVTLREKRFSEGFQALGSQDIKTVLVRNQTRYTPLNRALELDLFYNVATERSSRLERVFVRVTQGTGSYRYLGDLNGNGLADENEFEPTRFDGDFIVLTLPTDELFPVIDLKTSVRVRFAPARFLESTEGIFKKLASSLSTETYIRVDEKSSEPDLKQIYLLHFSKFQQDSTTIAGSTLLTQDVNVLEGQPSFSGRLRFSQRKGLNTFSTGIERSYARERSVRLRWQLVEEISNQVDFVNKVDRVTSQQTSSRLRDVLSNSIAFDLSYRPEQNIETGFRVEVMRASDKYQVPVLDADINTQTMRVVYAIQGAGQARAETGREEVILGRSSAAFPYELTGGRVMGKTWLWRAGFDYRVTQFIQATMNYDGRSEGGRRPVHSARAEVRAFF